MKLAVTGKGGVGKTTISAMLARTFAGRNKRVLAIDADPNGNLPEAVGYDVAAHGRLKPLIEEKDIIRERAGAAPGESFGGVFVLNPKVDDFIERFAKPAHGVSVMITGELREALTGCYCPENAVLRAFIRHLFVEREEWVILDMEAGFEHLTRGTADAVDALLVVVEPGKRSMRTAEKIVSLAGQIGIKKHGFVLNKVNGDDERRTVEKVLGRENLWAALPYTGEAVRADLSGAPPFERCAALREPIDRLIDRIIGETAP